jgi:hypothetical protein
MFRNRITFTAAEVVAYYRTRLPKLSQRGRQWRGVCALHRGKRFSFSVNPETGCWYCFADCGRGGSLIDFEMMLTGADFMTALAAVFAIVGRAMPERARMTRDEWQAAQEARERENQERLEALYFADAAVIMAEDLLEQLGSCDQERFALTGLIEGLLIDPRTVYLDCREHHPTLVAALIEFGRRLDWQLQLSLLYFIEEMAQEDCQDAA